MEITGVTGTAKDGLMTPAQRKFWDRRQKQSIQAVNDYWAQHGYGAPYPLIAAATGYGKGRVTAALVAQASNKKVLLIAGTKNLLARQSTDKFKQYFDGGNPASVVAEDIGATSFRLLSNKPSQGTDGVDVTIWQRLQSHAKRGVLSSYGLTVVDEAHNGGTTDRVKLLTSIQTEAVVGMTATAVRSSGDLRMPESYGFTVVDTVTLHEGLEGGWNSPFLGLAIDPKMVLPREALEGDGEISLRKLFAEMRKHPDYIPGVAKVLAEHYLLPRNGKPGPKTVLPVNRVKEEAVALARELRKYGISVGLAINQVDAKRWASEFPTYDIEERHRLPHDHPDAIQVVASPGVIGEGYDHPGIELIAFVVPTMSATRYTQVIGRGARACRGKAFCYVLDFPWFIEGYGYSLTFGQFFRREDLLELENGYVYLGSKAQRREVERAANEGKATGTGYADLSPEFFRSLPNAFRRIDLIEQNAREYPEAGDWLTAKAISELLGRSYIWVTDRLNTNSGELRKGKNGKVCSHYPPSQLERLGMLCDEAAGAGGWLTARAIGIILAVSRKWVTGHIDSELSQIRRDSTGCRTAHYSTTELERLRKLLKEEAPEARDWLTVLGMAESLGRSDRWIESHLNTECNELRKGKNGKIFPHYPPAELERLRRLSKGVSDAGSWVPAIVIATSLNKSFDWVEKRLDSTLGEPRRGKTGHVLPHYPPSEMERLRGLCNNEAPDAGDWLTLKEMGSAIGRGKTWIINHADSSVSEKRKGKDGRTYPRYPPSELERLRALSEQEEGA